MQTNFIREISIDWESVDHDAYYRKIPALSLLNKLEFDKNVTFFVGENGTGKSTLLEAMAVAYGFNAEGGSLNYRFSSKDTHSDLYENVRIIRGVRRPKDGFFLRAESFYNVATELENIMDGDRNFLSRYGGKLLHEQSHGESFLVLIQNRFWGDGIYLLDEPEAALSPQRQLTLLMQIHELAKRGSQFIIATHSPILLGVPDAGIYAFSTEGIAETVYEETESYQVMEMFINNREVILKNLLDG